MSRKEITLEANHIVLRGTGCAPVGESSRNLVEVRFLQR